MTGLRNVLSPAYTPAMYLLSGMAQPTTRTSVSAICAQPTSVIASPFDLEFFRVDQCEEEVEAEPDGDDQSDDRFTHSPSPTADAGRARRHPSTPKPTIRAPQIRRRACSTPCWRG